MENNKIKKDINNVVNDNLKALEQLFPSVVKDGQLDIKALKEELGDFEEVTTEKYELNWAGKQNAKKVVQQGIGNKTLKFVAKDSKNADTTENIYIEGDNLEVLKLLRQNYYNSIKMIYIDPPYNTGNDFVYNDTFKMDKEESDKAEGIISENNEKLQVKFWEPRIPYRETITKKAKAEYRHKKQSGGAGQFGEVHLIVEPYAEGMPDPTMYNFNGQEFKVNIKGKEVVDLEWGGKLVFINSVVGGAIDSRFMPAILKGIMDCMEHGPLTGSYARDVRVVVYDGKMHPVDSNELSFMLAARHAFADAFRNAGPKILEPIYDLEVFVPSDFMGDVMSDLQGRRALIMGMDAEAGYQKLQAKIPLKELNNYSISLSSLTGGRASFTAKFASYELVPTDLQANLISEHSAELAEEQD